VLGQPSPAAAALLVKLKAFMQVGVCWRAPCTPLQLAAQPLCPPPPPLAPATAACLPSWLTCTTTTATASPRCLQARCTLNPTPLNPSLQTLQARLYPSEATLQAHAQSDQRWTIHPLAEQLKAEARQQGLWNLWMPAGGRGEAAGKLPGSWTLGAGGIMRTSCGLFDGRPAAVTWREEPAIC